MNLKSQKILGIDVTVSSLEYTLEEMRKYLAKIRNPKSELRKESAKPLIIYTPNPEIINYAQKDKTFKEIVNSAQINIPDGAGVVWAIKKLFGIKVPKITGIDFMLELVKLSEKESLRIGLIGGKEGVAVKTLECLKRNYPKLTGWAMAGPQIKIPIIKDDIPIKEIVEKIISDNTDILFVAMGHPKQEYFINILNSYFLIHNSKPLILMAVGGSFDYISGQVSRAPLWVRNMGFEWFYRLIREPWRLSRQLKGVEFFLRVAFPSLFPIKYP